MRSEGQRTKRGTVLIRLAVSEPEVARASAIQFAGPNSDSIESRCGLYEL